MERLREAAERVVPHSRVVDKKREGEQVIPDPDQTIQLRVPVPGRQVPITSGRKKQWGLRGKRNCRILRRLLLKGSQQT